MKKIYEAPVIHLEQFVANECVAACSNYKVSCNAHDGWLYYYPKSDGQIDGVYEGSGVALPLSYYKDCHVKKVWKNTIFYDGFLDNNMNGIQDGDDERVIVWFDTRNNACHPAHATKNLDMSTWETDKS